ncbi:MAG: hypothetical protein OZSIB_1387 [Candidatus Ozemobacter sibiricus]|uniref:Uncharacterized protein n=1 Tax=Candidatus Ozemobacter sibiricus TaxID=2268124 RepID=A0A367ZKT6_9BACT|nr:MAG: hypothetical protein OZSIB_1387 [Candidatus Ozemobacter sibiricus]
MARDPGPDRPFIGSNLPALVLLAGLVRRPPMPLDSEMDHKSDGTPERASPPSRHFRRKPRPSSLDHKGSDVSTDCLNAEMVAHQLKGTNGQTRLQGLVPYETLHGSQEIILGFGLQDVHPIDGRDAFEGHSRSNDRPPKRHGGQNLGFDARPRKDGAEHGVSRLEVWFNAVYEADIDDVRSRGQKNPLRLGSYHSQPPGRLEGCDAPHQPSEKSDRLKIRGISQIAKEQPLGT